MAFVLPKIEEEKDNFILPETEKKEVKKENDFKLPFNVMEGSVLDKFDDQGNEIEKPIVERIKDFFTSDDKDIYKQEYEDPILKTIADVEKKYSKENYFSVKNFSDEVLYKSYLGIARDLGQGTIDFSNYIAKKFPGINDNVIDTKLPIIPEPTFFAGTFLRDVGSFAIGYSGVSSAVTQSNKIFKLPAVASKTMKSFQILATGGLAEQFAFSPREKRLSTIVEQYKDGKFSNSVTAYLQAVDTDSENVARAKMFAEGAILGVPLELLSWGIRGSINKFSKKNLDENTVDIATKEINDIKILSDNKIITLTSRLEEINKLKKQLKEIKDIKPKKNTTEQINIPKEEKILKTVDDFEINSKEDYFSVFSKQSDLTKEFTGIPASKKNKFIIQTELNKNLNAMQVTDVSILKNYRNIGLGKSLYKIAIRDAFNKNLDFISDNSISESALRVYKSLEKDGFKVTYNKDITTLKNNIGLDKKRGNQIISNSKILPVVTIKKTIVTDEIAANIIVNKKAAILKKLRPLEIEEKIFEATQANKAQDAFEYKFPKPRTVSGLDVPSDLTTPQLKLKVTKDASNAAEEIITAAGYKVNPYLRITEQMADVFNTNKISDDAIIRILKKNNLTQEKFAKIFLSNFSDAGRTLQVASTISKKVNQLRKLPGADDAWKKNIKDYNPDAFDRTGSIIKRLDNIKRGLLVTQLATAMRNFESQTMRQGVAVLEESFDHAFQSVFKSLFINGKPVRIATPINSLQGFLKIFSQLRYKNFKKVKKETAEIMSSFPKEDDRLFLRFSSDILSDSGQGGGLFKTPLKAAEEGVNLLNFANKFQEFITRRAVFQARLNNLILSNPTYYGGKTLTELVQSGKTNIIRRQDVASAVDNALEITYAKSFNANAKNAPYERTAGKFIDFVNSLPFIATSFIPFPRFLMNSLRFHFDFSPIGILNFLNKGERAALARGDTSKLSRAVIGIAMISSAYWLRGQPYAGEKWYEIKMGGKTFDTRAYNPFAAYLFVGDLFRRYENGTLRGLDVKGFASVFFGTRAGTGLYAIDKLIDLFSGEKVVGDPEKIINSIISTQLSAFLTPLTMFNDFMTLNDPNYDIVRDARSEKWGSVIKQVSPKDLPPIYSATSIEYTPAGFPIAKTIRRENAVLRQLTGATIIPEKNSAEKELDRLGFQSYEIFRSTGISELDKAIKMELAPMIAIGMSEIVEQDWYKKMSVPVQTLFIKKMLTEFKAKVQTNLPDTGVIPYLLEYKLNTMPNDKRKVIDELLGKEFIPNLIEQQHEKYKTNDKKKKSNKKFVLPTIN
jgi:hypothetical protein